MNNFFNIDESIEQLIKIFNITSKKGWFKKSTNNSAEIGNNFEKILGKEQDNLQVPDFYGIEIKTKTKGIYEDYITLFNLTPLGKDFYEINRLKEKYGYPDTQLRNCKILNGDIFCKNKNKIGSKYYFQTQVKYNENKIELSIFNKYGFLIDNHTFWPFETIKERINCKLNYLALISVVTKKINGKLYYKYENLEIYEFINFDHFLKAVENNYIKIQLKVGVFKSGKRFGQTHDRGTGFQINKKHINSIYKKIYSNKEKNY